MEVTHPDVQILATAANGFCRRWFNNNEGKRLFVVTGLTGSGKTHVARRIHGWASAVAYERWLRVSHGDALPLIQFVEWCHLGNPQRTNEESFFTWLKEVGDISLLIIDDIGTEIDPFKSGASTSRLCELLNHRAGKFTMFTTNVPAASWASRWDARVEDRLLRHSIVFEISAPSFVSFDPGI